VHNVGPNFLKFITRTEEYHNIMHTISIKGMSQISSITRSTEFTIRKTFSRRQVVWRRLTNILYENLKKTKCVHTYRIKYGN